MRLLAIAALSACLLVQPASAGRIDTGKDLVTECSDYLARGAAQDNNVARAPHPCRSFLQGFFVSLIERENARRDALVRGIPYSAKEKCVRLPGVLTYTDMAQRVINYTKLNPQALTTPGSNSRPAHGRARFPLPSQPGSLT
jgi:hypothetical protein